VKKLTEGEIEEAVRKLHRWCPRMFGLPDCNDCCCTCVDCWEQALRRVRIAEDGDLVAEAALAELRGDA